MFAVLSGSPLPVAWAADDCEPWVAQVVSIEGRVEARRAGQVLWTPVAFQETFCGGDSIRVEARSRAAILLRNETLLRLDQGTAITFSEIEEQQPSWLDLIRGAVHFLSRVPRTLQIRTAFVNAAIEGTEFAIRVDPQQATVWVFEGRVLASNEAGSLILMSGQTGIASVGQAPVSHAVVRPRNAVQWALYYPPIIDYRAAAYPPDPGVPAIQEALARYQAGDLQRAFARLETVPAGLRDIRYYTLRAGLLLSVGRVDEAGAAIEHILNIDPDNANAFALQAIIAVVQTEKDRALTLAQRAAELAPQSPVPQVALSYAHQARFDIDKALDAAQEAVNLAPTNALAWARLAELWLAMGHLDRALKAAQQSVRRNPDLARTQTVLGFAYLTRIEIAQARSVFETAIILDQADPLPRLGLGLAKIRASDLSEGRREIEIAASLDPNHSIIRSYLGKAYFEERRDPLAADQFAIAKELDPRDPTAWFYDAIRKQTINRPVEALHDIQKAIELNDNRAVYRSRMLLDDDLAARSAALGRIYSDLAFEQQALVEGWKSINTDFGNYSGHRLLADNYAALPRHEIARVSELLQSQLLQPINITPVPPHLGETDLFIVEDSGPAASSFNEFNPLFLRNRFALQASGVVGSNNTFGNEITHSGVWDKLSYSVGQFHYETDGFQDNNDLEQDIYNVFAQISLSPGTSFQGEFRHTEIEEGDRAIRFFLEEDFRDMLRQNREINTGRLGFHHTFTPESEIIGSIIYKNTDAQFDNLRSLSPFEVTLKEDAYLYEIQHLFQSEALDLISGVGQFNTIDRRLLITSPLLPFPVLDEKEDIKFSNLYLYSQINFLKNLILTLGLSANFFDGAFVERDIINPKFGLMWNPISGTTLRLTAFRVLSKEGLGISETIEPTQVAGFNQFRGTRIETDLENATREGIAEWRYGFAIDQKFSPNLYAGAEISKYELTVPGITQIIGSPPITFNEDWSEIFGRGYVYWTPNNWLATSAQYFFERFERGRRVGALSGIRELETIRIPLEINLFHPDGFSIQLKGTYVNQDGKFTLRNLESRNGNESFWVVDTAIRYRFPKRRGLVTIGVNNLFDEHFNFQETDFSTPFIQRDRFLFSRITLAF